MRRSLHPARSIHALLLVFAIPVDAQATDPVFADGFEPPPILHYLFDGDGGNIGTLPGYSMTLSGSAGYDTGESGLAISFPTTISYADVAGMKTALGSLAKVTVAFWYYRPAPVSGQIIWSLDNRSTAPYGGVDVGESVSSQVSVCVSTSSNAFLGGSCAALLPPATGTWHHWIIRYEGTGTGSGQGGPVQVYIDDVLVLIRNNDANNDPVFNAGIPDTLYIGGSGSRMDDLRIYDTVFSAAQQCAYIIGGAWTGGACTLP